MLTPAFGEKLSFHARHALKEARDIARYTRTEEIEPRHLLLALSLESGSLGGILLENIGFKKDAVGKLCLKKSPANKRTASSDYSPAMSPAVQTILKRAYVLAKEHGYPYVGTEHLVAALLESDDESLLAIVETLEVSEEKVRTALETHLRFEHFPELAKMFDLPDFPLSQGPHRERETVNNTSFLDQYAIDLAEAAGEGFRFVGRDREIDRLTHILGRKEKNNAILVGDPGVGKTALVTALALRMKEGLAGPVLSGKRIYSLDLALLVAGTSFRGEFENRVKELLHEVRQRHDVVLFIDEIHTLIGTGNTQGGLDAANILKPALARGEIQVIGATTFSEYKRHFEKDAALERRFQPLPLAEPNAEETLRILEHARPAYEAFHALTIDPEAIRATVELSVRYIPDRFLPDKALDLLDEAASLVRHRRAGNEKSSFSTLLSLERELAEAESRKEDLIAKGDYDEAESVKRSVSLIESRLQELAEGASSAPKSKKVIVKPADILEIVSRATGIPFARLSEDTPSARLERVRHSLRKKIIGQDDAKAKILTTLARSISNINDPNRPLGSFLFLGPTGVGKTYLAKVLAEEFFGDEKALVRLDMSEFMERHSVAQIIGAPAGYVGYGDGGKLTEAIRRRPYAVVLFDEVEKAHPDVFNILLQILDDGQLTDAEGRRVSFKNTLIILTSNIGTASFTSSAKVGFAESVPGRILQAEFEAIKREVLEGLKKELRPELLGRLDQTVVFSALDRSATQEIALLELDRLKRRLSAQGIALAVPESVSKWIAEKSFTPEQGARLIRKNIQEHVESILAEKMLGKRLPKKLSLSIRHDAVLAR
ncbi:MAG: ATP-dependent Clp protease ATP-binding subunit [Candidatus Moraniibacteriota bacterium]|nr:MAG: ATP-dependent Clp protease ATP-binding subunit [Candidatus Moranbacteria bacterium]